MVKKSIPPQKNCNRKIEQTNPFNGTIFSENIMAYSRSLSILTDSQSLVCEVNGHEYTTPGLFILRTRLSAVESVILSLGAPTKNLQ